jgi:hypothetical protein
MNNKNKIILGAYSVGSVKLSSFLNISRCENFGLLTETRAYPQSHELCPEEWEGKAKPPLLRRDIGADRGVTRKGEANTSSHSGLIDTVSSNQCPVTSRNVSTCQRINVSALKPAMIYGLRSMVAVRGSK